MNNINLLNTFKNDLTNLHELKLIDDDLYESKKRTFKYY